MDCARHLSTQCSPTIYYRPYILTEEQNRIIDEQVSQVQAEIDANELGTTFTEKQEHDNEKEQSPEKEEDDVNSKSNDEKPSKEASVNGDIDVAVE